MQNEAVAGAMKAGRPLWRKLLRSAICLALAVIVLVKTSTFLWFGLLLLALFFYGVDVHEIHKRKPEKGAPADQMPVTYGVLGEYEVDGTPSYGLFIELRGQPVFVDIRSDGRLEARKARAGFLFQHQRQLVEQLGQFLEAHPDFAMRTVQFIGLHANDVEQGEVFWDPDGYTRLKGLSFTT